jgi:hypothetical protein
MKEALTNAGFKEKIRDNTWVRDNWTIRFHSGSIEVFDDPMFNTPGRYYKGTIKDTNIYDVLEDIEKFSTELRVK